MSDSRRSISRFWRTWARVVVALRFIVVAFWLVAAHWALQQPHVDLSSGGAGLRDLAPIDLPAVQAELRAADSFPVPLHSRTLAVQYDAGGFSPRVQARIVDRAVRGGDERWPDLLGGIPLINQPPYAGSLPPAGTTAVTYLVFEPDTSTTSRTRQAAAFAKAVPEFEGESGMTGAVPARISTARLLRDALPRLELVTGAVIMVVVMLFYRSLLAPLVVLLTIAISFLMSQAALGAFARAFDQDVPREVEPLLVALLLGVVTDYCLFFVSSMRRALGDGDAPRDAAVRAIATTTPIVLVAGLTVAAGCASLAVATTDFLAAFGPALALTVVAAAAVSLTLVPALISILGRAAFLPSRVQPATSAGDAKRATVPRGTPMARLLTNRLTAIMGMIVVLVPLVFAAAHVRELRAGYGAVSGLPDGDPVREGQRIVEEGFAAGIIAPTVLLVEGERLTDFVPELVALQQAVGTQPGVAGTFGVGTADAVRELVDARTDAEALRDPLGLAVAPEGGSARMLVVLEDDPYGGLGVQRLRDLRDRLPELAREAGLPDDAHVSFAGDTAVVTQLVSRLRGDLLRVTVTVVLLNLLLLAVFLRSLVAPLLVVGASLLAVVASLGITTWVFQDMLGGDGITFYVPLASLVLLLSLGADYGIFAIGHAWGHTRTHTMRDALVIGSSETSSVIAVAGLLLGASFALLSVVPVDAFLQFAVAMSVGILIDTFVIRPVLLPSAVLAIGPVAMWPRRPAVE